MGKTRCTVSPCACVPTTQQNWLTVNRSFPAPTTTVLTSTTPGTYQTPPNTVQLRVRMVGGGSGGSSSGASTSVDSRNNSSTAGDTVFGPLTAAGGVGSGSGRPIENTIVSTTGLTVVNNSPGNPGGALLLFFGGEKINGQNGGASVFGGAGQGGLIIADELKAGGSASANSGSGGGGGSGGENNGDSSGFGGNAGGYIEAVIVNPSASYNYQVGAGSAGGDESITQWGGGNGADGVIIVDAYQALL